MRGQKSRDTAEWHRLRIRPAPMTKGVQFALYGQCSSEFATPATSISCASASSQWTRPRGDKLAYCANELAGCAGYASWQDAPERPCVDAPSDSRGCLRDLCAQVQVLPCVRPFDAAILTAAGLYGDRGSGPSRFGALEALGRSLVFPTPSSDRCAIPLDGPSLPP